MQHLLCAFIIPSVRWARRFLPGKLGVGAEGAVLTWTEPSLVPSPGTQDPGPGVVRKPGVSFPFVKHWLGTFFVQGRYWERRHRHDLLLQEAPSLVEGQVMGNKPTDKFMANPGSWYMLGRKSSK